MRYQIDMNSNSSPLEESQKDSFGIRKRKLLLEDEQGIKKKANMEVDENEASDILNVKIIPVLADEYLRSIETEPMFVGKITMKKETSRLIRELSSFWPLEGKSHLKRVRWTAQKGVFEILIRPVSEGENFRTTGSYSLKQVVGDRPINITGLEDEVFIVKVSKFSPATNSQYKAALNFWPVQFRENKYIEKVLNDKLFGSEERKTILNFMKMCISSAEYGDEKVSCVIVDPVSSKVVAIAHDRRQHHPIQHAVMVATDLVATSQGGGSWDIDSKHVYHLPYSKDETDLKITELKKLNPDKDVKKMCLPYLCTGYDAYVSREPCVMCAMALVHSRIRRVFYASEVSWGALGSHCNLHLQDGLNHHYEVWKVKLEKGFLHGTNDARKDDINIDLKS